VGHLIEGKRIICKTLASSESSASVSQEPSYSPHKAQRARTLAGMPANEAQPVSETEGVGPDVCLKDIGADILAQALVNLSAQDVARSACACSALKEAANRPFLWRHFLERDFAGLPGLPSAVPSRATASDLQAKWLQCKDICDLNVVEWEKIGRVDSEQTEGLPPSAREGHAAAVCDSRFVAVMGGFVFSDSLEVHLFDPEAAPGVQWSEPMRPECSYEVHEELVAGQRYGLSATACKGLVDGEMQNLIVVFGGCTAGGYVGEVAKVLVLKWSYDPDSKWPKLQWIDPTPPGGAQPLPRAYHSAAWVGNQLVIYGGICEAETIDELAALDLTTWTWTVHASADIDGDKPAPRFGHSATPYRRWRDDGTTVPTMVVVGGATSGYDLLRSGRELFDVFELEEAEEGRSFRWREVATEGAPASCGRCHSAVAVGSKVVLYGGLLPSRATQSAVVATLDLATWRWELPLLGGAQGAKGKAPAEAPSLAESLPRPPPGRARASRMSRRCAPGGAPAPACLCSADGTVGTGPWSPEGGCSETSTCCTWRGRPRRARSRRRCRSLQIRTPTSVSPGC